METSATVAMDRALKNQIIAIYRLQVTDYKLQTTNLQVMLAQPQSKYLVLFNFKFTYLRFDVRAVNCNLISVGNSAYNFENSSLK
jgi:hypothetical protein